MGGFMDASAGAGVNLADLIPKDRKPWWRDTRLLHLNFLLLSALLTQTASGFDSSMINGMQSLTHWATFFDHPNGTRLGAMTAGTTGGTLIAVLWSSQLCERFGRRWPIFGGSAVIILGSVLQGAAQNFGMFVAGRFIVGAGLCMVSTAAPPLLTECAYPTHRGVLVSMYMVSWPLGSLVAAWITYGTFRIDSAWSWRLPSLLQCSVSVVQMALVWFAPESPRWLIYNNRQDEARAFFAKFHGHGDADAPLVRFEMAEVVATLEMEKEQKQARWAAFFSTPGMRHRFFLAAWIPAMLQWSGNNLTSYYLTRVLNSIGITDSKTQLIINGCLSIWSFLTAFVFAGLVDRLGRRFLFLLGMAGMLLSYVIWTICSALNQQRNFEDHGLAAGVITMILVFSAFYHVQSPAAPTYIMEILPFTLRAKGAMLYQLTGNIAGIFNSFVNPIGMTNLGWRYYIVWCCVIAFNLATIYFFFPETRGYALEDVGQIFDGPDALTGTNAMRKMGMTVDGEVEHAEDAENAENADASTASAAKPNVQHNEVEVV
ncbi:sugar transporter [Sporothrix schenckii 1099-18]|uniref:Sugar transporter n=1 Tax=Sporothrix schenckii 1099-18 TaxID=1397361 RepID=A0A0F2M854_SPOSC|nr:sugar transporter [Sporothrix schenckii 1099-18]KJR85822.1 sugar transporter [Sporothrix schenckii 1099-18]